MLSTITPLAESGRGRAWGVTASWFFAGAVLGGLTLGVGTALLAAGVRAAGLSDAAVLAIAAVAALLGAASDARIGGLHLPHHTRQVNEDWLSAYRAWVYGGGFGWQIGVGLATYIMTAAVYLTIVLAALTAGPLTAVAIAVLFGTVRGLAIFLSARITSPAALLSFHRRFDALGEPVRLAVIGVQVAVGLVAAAAAGGPAALAVATGAVVGGALVAAVLRRAAAPETTPAPPVPVSAT
jgi:hypothetical protein